MNGHALLAVAVAAQFGLLATVASASEDIGGTGRIEPDGGVVILNGVPGARILSIAVHPGQMVKKGDLLMTLDDHEQRVSTQIAEVALVQAHKDATQNLAAAETTVSIDSERLQHADKNAEDYKALGPDATSEKQIADSRQAAAKARRAVMTVVVYHGSRPRTW